MIAAAAEACRDLADYIDRSGAASSRFLRHVAGCLRWIPRDHCLRRQTCAGRPVDRVDELFNAILAGKAQPDELRAFADVLGALEAA